MTGAGMSRAMVEALPEIVALARVRDPDRFLCALFAPRGKREALCALLCFEHELARALAVVSQPMAALIRLQWWREVVEGAVAGAAPRRHEVALPLHAAIAGGGLAAGDLLALVEAREAAVETQGETPAALFEGLRASGGGVAVAAGRLLGAPEGTLPALREAGAAHALGMMLRGAGRAGAGLPGDARVLAVEGMGLAEAARSGLRALPRGAIAAALPLVLARRDLRRIAAGRAVAEMGARRIGDRLAVVVTGLAGRV